MSCWAEGAPELRRDCIGHQAGSFVWDESWEPSRVWCVLCRQALKPRLLVVIALAAGMGLYNSQAKQPLGGAEEFSLLGGFLSYKVRPSVWP